MGMKFLPTLLILFPFFFLSNAQNCLEIESILVDACGSPEGENEMVRIKIGSQDILVADITVDWPNNSFQGFCQNALTAEVTDSLNATIAGCGWLVEPTGGVLPAGASVLIITSEDMDYTANSFTNLQDTLVVIYQCTGNTQGHFANYDAGGGFRTLIIEVANPVGCNDTATYQRDSLINQLGFPGGTTAQKNGGRVDFAVNGDPTYANDGCSAPIVQYDIDLSSPESVNGQILVCLGDTIQIDADVSSGLINFQWTGTDNILLNGEDSTFLEITTSGGHFAYFQAESVCGDVILDSIFISTQANVQTSISLVGGDTILCPGEQVTLEASGSGNFQWNTGEQDFDVDVSSAGTYVVQLQGQCNISSDSISFSSENLPIAEVNNPYTEVCPNDTVWITAIGDSILWFNDSTYQTFIAEDSGVFYVTNTNICGTDTAFAEVVWLNSADCGEPFVPSPYIEFPNIVTANGDLINDVFMVKGYAYMEDVHVEIYGRWGNFLYEWDGLEGSWDGRYDPGNTRVEDGVYYFVANATDYQGEKYLIKGFFQYIKGN